MGKDVAQYIMDSLKRKKLVDREGSQYVLTEFAWSTRLWIVGKGHYTKPAPNAACKKGDYKQIVLEDLLLDRLAI